MREASAGVVATMTTVPSIVYRLLEKGMEKIQAEGVGEAGAEIVVIGDANVAKAVAVARNHRLHQKDVVVVADPDISCYHIFS